MFCSMGCLSSYSMTDYASQHSSLKGLWGAAPRFSALSRGSFCACSSEVSVGLARKSFSKESREINNEYKNLDLVALFYSLSWTS